jgi:hypothetical protein
MMSSEISIDAGRMKGGLKPAPTTGPDTRDTVGAGFGRPDGKPDEGFRPWHFFVLSSILLATVAVMLSRQSSPEGLILISLTISAAGFAAAAFYRMLAPLTQPFVLRAGEPVSERTRAALEREKLLVLRTIKELEFDRAMGKLAQKDFEEMAGRLRARALSLMHQLDLETGSYAGVIEQELAARVAKQVSRQPALAPHKTSAPTLCACGTHNDVDAIFCKKCGTRISG